MIFYYWYAGRPLSCRRSHAFFAEPRSCFIYCLYAAFIIIGRNAFTRASDIYAYLFRAAYFRHEVADDYSGRSPMPQLDR